MGLRVAVGEIACIIGAVVASPGCPQKNIRFENGSMLITCRPRVRVKSRFGDREGALA